uniref:Ig-like domain-containing protein n=1 Tax=Neogobius melanostomus TaxID=47308 RepID=A0A8C6SI01_9GOBI
LRLYPLLYTHQIIPGDSGPAPPVFTRKLRKAAVGTGCDIRLRVTVTGRPAPTLCWYQNEQPVTTSGRFSLRTSEDGTAELRITSAQRADSGAYVCKVINEHGVQQAQCSVDVTGTQLLYSFVWLVLAEIDHIV